MSDLIEFNCKTSCDLVLMLVLIVMLTCDLGVQGSSLQFDLTLKLLFAC